LYSTKGSWDTKVFAASGTAARQDSNGFYLGTGYQHPGFLLTLG